MKKILILSLGLVLLFSLSCSKSTKPTIQSGWELLYVGEDVDLLSVSFVDENYGWVGARSYDWQFTLFHTTDGGNSWVKQKLPYSNSAIGLGKVFFIDRNNGWVVGSVGIIAHTTDGGKSWSLKERVVSHAFHELQFVDINHGSIYGGGYFLRTTDGGENWSLSTGVGGFHFFDSLNGFADIGIEYGKSDIVQTSDGGVTWNKVADRPANTGGIAYVDFEKWWGLVYISQPFTDSLFSWIVHTTDAGKNWTPQTEVFRAWLDNLIMIDEHYGWVGKGLNSILHTSNGGETWIEQLTPVLKGYIFDTFFLDREHGWAVAEHGQILRTKNGGNTITK
ncbi:MAG: YCF48-related protein [Candidatus Zixiibacteriota bacterium]